MTYSFLWNWIRLHQIYELQEVFNFFKQSMNLKACISMQIMRLTSSITSTSWSIWGRNLIQMHTLFRLRLTHQDSDIFQTEASTVWCNLVDHVFHWAINDIWRVLCRICFCHLNLWVCLRFLFYNKREGWVNIEQKRYWGLALQDRSWTYLSSISVASGHIAMSAHVVLEAFTRRGDHSEQTLLQDNQESHCPSGTTKP